MQVSGIVCPEKLSDGLAGFLPVKCSVQAEGRVAVLPDTFEPRVLLKQEAGKAGRCRFLVSGKKRKRCCRSFQSAGICRGGQPKADSLETVFQKTAIGCKGSILPGGEIPAFVLG